MQDHPLPQDITGYQFHIIGNMTLKQFAEVGAGIFIAFLVYTTNLTVIIKWPLIGLFVGLGVVAAFVPIEERPFDQWIAAFFKAIYKPTKFFWKREPKIPDFFFYQPINPQNTLVQEIDLSPARRDRIKEYMTTVHQPPALDPLEIYQNQRIGQIISVFDQVVVSQQTAVKILSKPDLTVRVRNLKAQDQKPKTKSSSPTNQDKDFITQRNTDANKIAQEIQVPELSRVKISNKDEKKQENVIFSQVSQTNQQTYVEAGPTTKIEVDQSQLKETSYNRELPFPSPPTEPNIPVGMTIDQDGHLVPNAIVEIISQDGVVVRAVKTNSLGQFFVTTPLGNGLYTIQAEKDDLFFPPIKLDVIGEIILPVEIKSSNLSEQNQQIAQIN